MRMTGVMGFIFLEQQSTASKILQILATRLGELMLEQEQQHSDTFHPIQAQHKKGLNMLFTQMGQTEAKQHLLVIWQIITHPALHCVLEERQATCNILGCFVCKETI